MTTKVLIAACSAIALFTLHSGAMTYAAEPKQRTNGINFADLPNEIFVALDRAAKTYEQPLKGAKWSKAHRLDAAHGLYQVRGTNGRGNTIEAEITGAGRIIEIEEHGIPIDEVPAVVVQTLKARLPDFKPDQIEAIYQMEQSQPVCFGFEGKDAAGRKVEIYISADGKKVLN
jgi:hypothetical protein